MLKFAKELNDLLSNLEKTQSAIEGFLQNPWEWITGAQSLLFWSWSWSPVPQLRYILNQNQHDENNLKIALREFLKNHYQGKHNFTNTPLDLLCIRIAQGIADKNESILAMLIPELDQTADYFDDTMTDLITLKQVTEYIDFKTGKRRLKDLTQFFVSEDRKRVMGYMPICQQMIATKNLEFIDLRAPDQKPLTAKEKIYLAKSSPIVQKCIEYVQPPKTSKVLLEPPIELTSAFLTKHKDTPKDTLYYELELLNECLLNGGVTRRNIKDDDVIPADIAVRGIKRFRKIWFSLKEKTRGDLGDKTGVLWPFNQYQLGPLIFRIFLEQVYDDKLSEKEKNFSKTASETVLYTNLACIEGMSRTLSHFISSLSDDLKQIKIKSPSQGVVLAAQNDKKDEIKELLKEALEQLSLVENPLETVGNLDEFFVFTRRLQRHKFIEFCETNRAQLIFLIRNQSDSDVLKEKLTRAQLDLGISHHEIYVLILKIYNENTEKFKSCCSVEMLEYILQCRSLSEGVLSFWFGPSYTYHRIKQYIQENNFTNEQVDKVIGQLFKKQQELLSACKKNSKYTIKYLLRESNNIDQDLRRITPDTAESALSSASSDNDLFKWMLEEFYYNKFETLFDVTIESYIRDKKPADKKILTKILQMNEENKSIDALLNRGFVSSENWWGRYREMKHFKRCKEEGVRLLTNGIKLMSLPNLVTLLKLMVYVQNSSALNIEVSIDNKLYSCNFLNTLRKERYESGYGNTHSWHQVMIALQHQIKLRFQAGLIDEADFVDKETCVQFLQIHSDRWWHISKNNQAWVDEHLDVSEDNITMKQKP